MSITNGIAYAYMVNLGSFDPNPTYEVGTGILTVNPIYQTKRSKICLVHWLNEVSENMLITSIYSNPEKELIANVQDGSGCIMGNKTDHVLWTAALLLHRAFPLQPVQLTRNFTQKSLQCN